MEIWCQEDHTCVKTAKCLRGMCSIFRGTAHLNSFRLSRKKSIEIFITESDWVSLVQKSIVLTSLIWYTHCSSLHYSNRFLYSGKKRFVITRVIYVFLYTLRTESIFLHPSCSILSLQKKSIFRLQFSIFWYLAQEPSHRTVFIS